MKDEIKEINIPENVLVALGDLTNGALNYYKATETVKVKYNTTLDYITNLEKENERLKENAKILSNGYDDLEKRNEKIIRKISLYRMDDITMESNRILNDLLNVALGEDKDVKD